jgi:hypothetical protein
MRGPRLEGAALGAVRHRGSHLQIIAAAGSGKTEVVSQRVADLPADGVAPGAIVAFTFTERAAAELRQRIAERAEDRLGRAALDRLGGLFVGTIHAYCFRLLQTHIPRYETYDVVLLTWGPEWFDGGEVNPWPERVYTNGIYDPATDAWTRPAARPPRLQPGYGGRVTWTGREVLLWGLGGGVAYDPATDTWRAMATAPFTREFASYAWTGTELLVWGGTTGQDCADGCPSADGLAYQPGFGVSPRRGPGPRG